MGGFSVRPTGEQTLPQAEVDRLVREMRMAPQNRQKPVLGINMAKMMQAKNNGYPKHLYHATLAPRLALDEIEEEAYVSQGYSDTYIPHEYPKFLHRRNMDQKFEPKFDLATNVLIAQPWVETREVKTAKDEATLRAMHPKKGQSAWYESLAELEEKEPIAEPSDVDPQEEIARLRGKLEALEGVTEAERPKRGRPRKVQDEEPVTA